MQRRDFLQTGLIGAMSTVLPNLVFGSEGPFPAGVSSLDRLAKSRGLRFGSAISLNSMSDPDYAGLVLEHSGVLVAENALKWQYLEQSPRLYSDREARWAAELGAAKSKAVRGHCFMWNHHQRMPPWLVELAARTDEANASDLTRHMWRHGAYLARRFHEIDCWDAMNEVIDPATGEMRETHFTRVIGNRFFDLAFRIMHERFPDARLVLNETMSWEMDSRHRDGVLRLLERAKARDLPLHALGIQSHIGKTLGRPINERAWREFLQTVQDMGLEVVITEFDCSDRNVESVSPRQRDADVAAHSKAYLDLTLDFTNVREIVVWSLGDGPSYTNRPSYPNWGRRSDGLPIRAHPFDSQLRAKPMFDAIVASLQAAPDR